LVLPSRIVRKSGATGKTKIIRQTRNTKMKNTKAVQVEYKTTPKASAPETRTTAEEAEFQQIKHSHQGDSTWSRYQQLARKGNAPRKHHTMDCLSKGDASACPVCKPIVLLLEEGER